MIVQNPSLTFGIELEFADIRTTFLRKHLPPGWECQGDNSIRNSDGSYSLFLNPSSLGTEVKTIGGFNLPDLIAQLPVIYGLVAERGGCVTKSCGLHVHVSFGSWTTDHLLSLATYFLEQPSFAEAVKCSKIRTKNQCSRVSEKMVRTIEKYKDEPELKTLKYLSAKIAHQYVEFRQVEVNVLSLLHHGTIEYRAFNQTMDVQCAINCARYADEVTRAALAGLPMPLPTYPLPRPL